MMSQIEPDRAPEPAYYRLSVQTRAVSHPDSERIYRATEAPQKSGPQEYNLCSQTSLVQSVSVAHRFIR